MTLVHHFCAPTARRILAAVLFASASLTGAHAAPPETSSAESASLVSLATAFIEAQTHFNLPALRALTSEQFVEISPLGDVDPREKMLGFYVRDTPPPLPPVVQIEEPQVRVFGDSAIVTVKLSLIVNGQPRNMRDNFVAHKEGAQWKLMSVQHTPMRPPAKP
jgi:hypothetical protein